MAFVLKQSESYVWPVTVHFAVDGGRQEKQTFDVEFRRVGQERIDQMVEEARTGQRADRETCKELVIGWRGVMDGDSEIPFSQTALAQMLDVPGLARAVIEAWGESLTGAPAKN